MVEIVIVMMDGLSLALSRLPTRTTSGTTTATSKTWGRDNGHQPGLGQRGAPGVTGPARDMAVRGMAAGLVNEMRRLTTAPGMVTYNGTAMEDSGTLGTGLVLILIVDLNVLLLNLYLAVILDLNMLNNLINNLPLRREQRSESDGEFLYVPGWGRGAALLPRERRAAGFYRNGVWVDRPRNDMEERWQRGGGGEVRTQRREDRQQQWLDGTFRPAAFRRAAEQARGGLVPNPEMREHFREILRRADGRVEPQSRRDEPPPTEMPADDKGNDDAAHQVLGDGTFSSPWWTAEEWRRWRARRGRSTEQPVEVGLDWSGPGMPSLVDFVAELMGGTVGGSTCSCEGVGTSTYTSSSTSSSCGTTDTLVNVGAEEVRVGTMAGEEEEAVTLMQTGVGLGGPEREGEEEDVENASLGNGRPVDDAVPGPAAPEEPDEPYGLSADERDELVELGWDEGVVNDLHEFLLYLQETRDGAGAEAVAWAVGQWAHALILAESTLDLAADTLFRRVQGVAEQRPPEYGVRGRLCVGFAGFQKILGEMHLRIAQRLLQDEWMSVSEIGDPPLLGPAGGVIAGDTNTAALALEVARERARDLVERARRIRRERRAAGASRSSWEDANNGDVAHGGPGGDEGDSHSLMQLTLQKRWPSTTWGWTMTCDAV